MIISVLSAAALALTAYLAYAYPRYAALLLVGILPAYIIRLQIGPIPTTYLELSTWVILIIFILVPATRIRLQETITSLPRGALVSIALFLLAASISVAISSELRVSLGILKGWIITPLVGAFAVRSMLFTSEHRRQALAALIVSAVVVSVLAFILPFHEGRLVSIYDTPNSLALFVSPILTMAIWQVGQTVSRRQKTVLAAASTVMATALIGSQSVGGVIATLAALVIGILIWLPGAKRRQALVGMSVATLISALALWQTGKIPYLLQPLQNPQTVSSASVRWQLWSISAELIKENPMLGIGLGQFEPAYQARLHQRFQNYQLPTNNYPLVSPIPEFVFRDPHNWIISFWLNTGLLGLVSFITLNIFARKWSWQPKESSRIPYFLLLISILLFGLVDTIYWKNDLAVLYWITFLLSLQGSKITTVVPSLIRKV